MLHQFWQGSKNKTKNPASSIFNWDIELHHHKYLKHCSFVTERNIDKHTEVCLQQGLKEIFPE